MIRKGSRRDALESVGVHGEALAHVIGIETGDAARGEAPEAGVVLARGTEIGTGDAARGVVLAHGIGPGSARGASNLGHRDRHRNSHLFKFNNNSLHNSQ